MVGMGTEFEVMNRQEVKVIHDLDQVSSADFSHIVLLGIVIGDFLVDPPAGFPDQIWIGGIITGTAHSPVPDHDSLQSFISENPPRSAPGCLFHPDFFPAGVIKAQV